MTMDRNEYNKLSQPYAKVAADGERNFWMTAKEALEYGMVNQILNKKQ